MTPRDLKASLAEQARIEVDRRRLGWLEYRLTSIALHAVVSLNDPEADLRRVVEEIEEYASSSLREGSADQDG